MSRSQQSLHIFSSNKYNLTKEQFEELVTERNAIMAEELLGNEEFIKRLAEQDMSLAKKILTRIKHLIEAIRSAFTGKEADETLARLKKAQKLYEDALATAGQRYYTAKASDWNKQMQERFDNRIARAGSAPQVALQYSLGKTTGGKIVVIIDEDILGNSPKSQWIGIVKTAMKKFSGGIPIAGKLIKVNRISRDEFTESKNTKYYRSTDNAIYKDKLNVSNQLDEIVLASANYVNEDLNHERKDSIVEFARGDVFLSIDGRNYLAKVIVGYTVNKEMVLYDVVDFVRTNFNIKENVPIGVDSYSDGTSSNNNISNNLGKVNTSRKNIQYSFSGKKADTADTYYLSIAKDLQSEGVDNDTIRKKTGWFVGKDGNWKFEISDQHTTVDDNGKVKAWIKENNRVERTNEKYRRDFLEAQKLYEKATESVAKYATIDTLESLTDEKAVRKALAGAPQALIENYVEARNRLEEVDARDYLDYNLEYTTTLGEVLHNNRLYSAYPDFKNMKVVFNWSNSDYSGEYSPSENTIYVYTHWIDDVRGILMHEAQHAIQEVEGFAPGTSVEEAGSFDDYYASLGEVEARDVETRLDMTDKQRREISPRNMWKDIRYSRKSFAEQVDDVLAGVDTTSTHVKVMETPEILQKVGLKSLPMLMTASHVKSIVNESGEDGRNYHGLGAELLKQLPSGIEKPVMIMESLTRSDSIVVLTELLDKNNNPIIVAIKASGFGNQDNIKIVANIVASAYGKTNLQGLLDRTANANKVLYWNKEKSQTLLEIPGLQLPDSFKLLDSDVIIRKARLNVNTTDKKIQFSKKSLAKTLKGMDGKPLADRGMTLLKMDNPIDLINDEEVGGVYSEYLVELAKSNKQIAYCFLCGGVVKLLY